MQSCTRGVILKRGAILEPAGVASEAKTHNSDQIFCVHARKASDSLQLEESISSLWYYVESTIDKIFVICFNMYIL